jgi:hypothetical protein
MDTEVHLDERKRVKREEQLSPTFSTPAPPLQFHPFLHLLITYSIYSFIICLVRTSLLQNSLEQNKKKTPSPDSCEERL